MQPARDHPLFLCGFWMCISIVDWNKSVHQFLGVWSWPLTFRGHLRSKIFSPFKSPYMTSYLTSVDTFSLSHTVVEIFDFKVQGLALTFRGHLGSKIFSPFESAYMSSCLTSIDSFSPSCTVFEIFDFKVFRFWPWPLKVTWGQKYFNHSKAHTWLPI